MDYERLVRQIRLGEDSTLELKRILLAANKVKDPKRDDFADELVAMANRKRGTLVLGVDDKSREVLGIPLEGIDGVEAWVREICNDSIKPRLDADINKIELPDSEGRLLPVIVVVVPRSLFAHESAGGHFRRVGSSKRKVAPEVLARLFQERRQSRMIRFDETPVPDSSPEDLDPGLARRFPRPDAEVTATALRKLRVVADDEDDVARITVSGALHFVRRNMLVGATKRTGRVDLRQYSRNELIVSLLARCAMPTDESLGRSHIMDRRGDGVPVIRDQSHELSGRMPEYDLIDDSELRLIIWGGQGG